jgi:hypothetical protein
MVGDSADAKAAEDERVMLKAMADAERKNKLELERKARKRAQDTAETKRVLARQVIY